MLRRRPAELLDDMKQRHYRSVMRGHWRTAWMHVAVLTLVAPLVLALACSGALPLFAHWLGDTAAHVCACSVHPGHETCGCPICEHRADQRSRFASVRGKCGEDSAVFGGGVGLAVPRPAIAWPPAHRARLSACAFAPPGPLSVFLTPPTPPPRSLA